MKEAPLRAPTVAAYGAPGLVLAALALTFYVFLPKYYADVVGINLTVLGVVVLVSRVWDAVIDPAIGALSDRTRSRWGRRRPWMAGGALPLALIFVLLVVIPNMENALLEGLYLGALTFVFFFFWTTVTVPYEALGAELSFDYDERTRLLGVREGAVLAGTLLAAVIPIAIGIGSDFSRHLPSERQRYLLLGGIYAVLTVVLVGVCVLSVPERSWAESQRPRGLSRSIRSIFGNRPFRTLLAAYAVSALGVSVAATTILFYTEYVLGSSAGPIFLAIYLGIGTATVPGWIYLARRLDKRRAWLLALGLNTGAFVWAMLLGWGDGVWFGVIVVLSALGLGGVMGLPPSMQADVIDYDEWTSGRRREGEYIGFWSIVKKLAAAASAGLAFPILDLSGYAPGVEQQTAGAVWALRLLYVGTPSVCNLIAIAVAWRYPISRGLHEQIRRDIDARMAAAEPLPATS
ncbi:MAG: glycoside-pentoside-hexuronide (GPH):cation symporter [Gemmatimonadales bacterium]